MDSRIATGVATAAVVLGIALFWFVTRPEAADDAPAPPRAKPAVEKLQAPRSKRAPDVDAAKEAPVLALADEPDVEFDPMSSYPLNKQGMEGAFAEMQLEFDACRNERGVKVDPTIEVLLTVRRASPPHEEYGTEPGEIWGMVTELQVVGADPAAMKPFTDCVQDNLHDLLFDPPTQEAVAIRWPMTFTN